jgi:hypothetical protein
MKNKGMLDQDRYGMKEGGPGIEALRKEAPEVVERMGYEEGGSVLDILSTLNEKQKDKIYKDFMKQRTNNLKKKYGNDLAGQVLGGAINISEQIMSGLGGSGFDRVPLVTKADDELFLSLAKKELKRKPRQEGGSVDNQMLMVMTPPMESEMESDDDMEDGYTRFIMEEALSEEEEDMLTSKLEQDEELSMLFDKIIDVAQEFAGSGPVEGPGSGVSDSIPARLSDGEFVFTAKAVEEIGEDTLMSMMKDAEAAADERQGLAEGGMPEDNNVNVQADALLGMDMSPDPTQEAINENMIKYQPYVRS